MYQAPEHAGMQHAQDRLRCVPSGAPERAACRGGCADIGTSAVRTSIMRLSFRGGCMMGVLLAGV